MIAVVLDAVSPQSLSQCPEWIGVLDSTWYSQVLPRKQSSHSPVTVVPPSFGVSLSGLPELSSFPFLWFYEGGGVIVADLKIS